jgi:hypothetical protein
MVLCSCMKCACAFHRFVQWKWHKKNAEQGEKNPKTSTAMESIKNDPRETLGTHAWLDCMRVLVCMCACVHALRGG